MSERRTGRMASKLDRLDVNLLRALSSYPRASIRTLAALIGVSPSTVSKRLAHLKRAGILLREGLRLWVDYEKLGFDLTAVIEVTVSKGKLLEVERKIAEDPHVTAVYDVTGPSDVIVVARFENRGQLSKFVKGLLAMPHVERTNTRVVLNVIKEDDSELINLLEESIRE